MDDQRQRSIEEYSNLLNCFENFKILQSEATIDFQSQIATLQQQLEQSQKNLETQISEMNLKLQLKDQEVDQTTKECDSYKEQINQFSNNYKALNDHLKDV